MYVDIYLHIIYIYNYILPGTLKMIIRSKCFSASRMDSSNGRKTLSRAKSNTRISDQSPVSAPSRGVPAAAGGSAAGAGEAAAAAPSSFAMTASNCSKLAAKGAVAVGRQSLSGERLAACACANNPFTIEKSLISFGFSINKLNAVHHC